MSAVLPDGGGGGAAGVRCVHRAGPAAAAGGEKLSCYSGDAGGAAPVFLHAGDK